MLLQISLQLGVALYELLIFYQGRILAKLLGGFPVVVQELVETGQLTTGGVAVARRVVAVAIGVTGVFTPVKAIFLAHESVWIFVDFLANSRMSLQVGLQIRILVQEFLVLRQRWISAKLFSRLAVLVHELVETRQLAASGVAIARRVVTVTIAAAGVFTPVKAIFLAHEGVWIFAQFLADSRMLLEISLQRLVILQKFPVLH